MFLCSKAYSLAGISNHVRSRISIMAQIFTCVIKVMFANDTSYKNNNQHYPSITMLGICTIVQVVKPHVQCTTINYTLT